MKVIFILIAALSFFGLISYNVKKADIKSDPVAAESVKTDESTLPEPLPSDKKSPVLVELFTSEGCSSCPPADKALININEKQPFSDAEVITLSMHVDYWNRLGWTDKFSSAQFSERQSSYSDTFNLDGVYTPQMVVDGTTQFVGGNLNEAKKAVTEAVKSPKADVELTVSGDKLQVKISNLPEHSAANVLVAIAEDNLSTNVQNGENGGRTLNHTSVVRELKIIGTIAANDKSFEKETAFQIQSSWKKQNLKLVVFAQTEKNNRVIGVNQIKL